MLFSAPGVQDVLVEVAELATGVACCEDDEGCEERPDHECPQSCVHGCCAHPTALPPAPAELAATYFTESVATFDGKADDLDLVEHRAPPFRPPAG